jgi:hypothetical protein
MACPSHRESTAGMTAMIVALVLLLALLVGYVLAYYWLAVGFDFVPAVTGDSPNFRYYRHQWQAVMFRPAAMVESAVIGCGVLTAIDGQLGHYQSIVTELESPE